jgi:hypothetical protein
MKYSLALLTVLFLSGCSLLDKVPDKFDNVEYERLIQLSVDVDMVSGCDVDNIQSMLYNSRVLKKYSQGTLGKETIFVYEEINDLVEEMNNREAPSVVYCELKRKNIRTLTDKAIQVYGRRIK